MTTNIRPAPPRPLCKDKSEKGSSHKLLVQLDKLKVRVENLETAINKMPFLALKLCVFHYWGRIFSTSI